MARGVGSTAGPTCLQDDTRRADGRQRAYRQPVSAVSLPCSHRARPPHSASALPSSRGDSCSGGFAPSLEMCLARRVKRRRSRSSASGAGLNSIRPMRGSRPAYLGFFGFPWFLVAAKSSLCGVLGDPQTKNARSKAVWTAGTQVGTAYRVVHP